MPQARSLDSLRIVAPSWAESVYGSVRAGQAFWALGPLGWKLIEVGNIGETLCLCSRVRVLISIVVPLTEEFWISLS